MTQVLTDAVPQSSQTLTVKEVALACKVHEKTIWRWLRHNQFPRPITLGVRCRRWTLESITQFLAGQVPQTPK